MILWLVQALIFSTFSTAPKQKLWHEEGVIAAQPMGIAIRDGKIWITDLRRSALLKADLKTGKIEKEYAAMGVVPTGLTFHNGVLHYAVRRHKFLYRFDPGAKESPSPVPYYERWAHGVASDKKMLYVVDAREEKIHVVDPRDGTTVRSFKSPQKGVWSLAWAGGTLYTASYITSTIHVLDPETGWVIRSFPSPGGHISALTVHNGLLYAAQLGTGKIFSRSLTEDITHIEDDERRVRAKYRVVLEPRGKGEIVDLDIYLAVPPQLVGQKIHGEIQFSPKPAAILEDRWGQKVAHFHFPRVSSHGITVEWQGRFSLYRVRYQLKNLPGTIQGPQPGYLADDSKYDMASTLITSLAKKLGGKTPYEKSRAIYGHLTSVISYDRSGGWNNAARVLQRGTGSCSEYTFALVALLRKSGVPARYVGAISDRGGPHSFDDVYHRWAEAWLPGYGWIPIDANAGYGGNGAQKGFHFGGRSNRHIITTIGGGSSKFLDWTYNHSVRYKTRGTIELRESSYAEMVSEKKVPETGGFLVKRIKARRPALLPQGIGTVPLLPKGASMAPDSKQGKEIRHPVSRECPRQATIGMLMYLVWGAIMMFGGVAMGLMWASRKRRS